MKNNKLLVLLVLLLILAAMTLSSCDSGSDQKSTDTVDSAKTQSEKVNLTINDGPIQGLKTDDISIYKGIPFASCPVRFAPPEDAKPWTDTLVCEEYGPIPVQAGMNEDQTMSEDCLNLNVWTPAKSGDEKLPVYVWIYGGGFAMGSNTSPSYDGTNFAKDGVVTVNFNYRVNAVGFFASQETFDKYGTTGNWGLLDQIKALEWVQENIEAFGGDPNNVTIGGESAGSYSTSGLIASPLAEGLFKRAIMESGSMIGIPGNNSYSRGDLDRSIEVCNEMAFTFGADDSKQGLAKMRKADARVISQLSPLETDFTKTPAYFTLPVFDGHVMPEDLMSAVQDKKINKVDLLWGFNKNEGSVFIPADRTDGNYEMLANRMFGSSQAQKVMDRFPIDDENDATERARQILGYGMFSAVMKPFGDSLSEMGGNVYAYNFDYAGAADKEAGLGASHGSEIIYAFGNLPEDATEAEKQLSDEFHSRMVNFIKTGDPNNGDVPTDIKWPKYDPDKNMTMIFNEELTVDNMPDKDNLDFMLDIMRKGIYFK